MNEIYVFVKIMSQCKLIAFQPTEESQKGNPFFHSCPLEFCEDRLIWKLHSQTIFFRHGEILAKSEVSMIAVIL